MKPVVLGTIAAAVLCSTSALAGNYYVGLTGGQTDYDVKGFDKPTSFELMGGYKFHPNYAVEVSYHDFGEADENFQAFGNDIKVSVDGRSLGTALKIILPAGDKFSFYIKGGVHYWDIDAEVIESRINGNSVKVTDSDNDTELFYGIGLDAYIVKDVSLGIRYTSFQADESDALSVFGLNVSYHF